MSGAVIVSGARTPIGKLLGSLGSTTAPQLGTVAIESALKRANVSGDVVDYVIMGQVLQAGSGQAPARQAAVGADIPMTVASTTINKVCLSGLHAIYLADQMINSGDAEIVVAGGMESMSNAPYLLPNARRSFKDGQKDITEQDVIDSMDFDGLFCALEHRAMGASTDAYNERDGKLSREAQDEFAYESHMRAAKASDKGVFAEEIASDGLNLEADEGIRRDTSLEALSKLKSAFGNGGTITAGNASQLSDGGAAVVLMSRNKAESLGVQPLAEIAGYGMVAGPDPSLLTQPSRAIKSAAEKASVQISDIDLFEINEAFATVALAATADLSVPSDIVNVNGGAIALGHPIGMSGARLAITLAYEMKRRGVTYGAAGLCGGGGQGDAVILKTV